VVSSEKEHNKFQYLKIKEQNCFRYDITLQCLCL